MSKYSRLTVVTAAEGTFYDAVDAAESARQVALVGASQAATRTANINFHRSIVQAAAASGQGHLGGPSRQALYELTGSYT